jgi:Family of unknown function (DUF6267)
MKILNILTEAPAVKVGRPFQHLEDLVFMEGSQGAMRSIARLEDVARGTKLRYKWDGKPQVYWGREPDGTFVMSGHPGWLRADQTGKARTAGQLASYIMNTGKAADDAALAQRQQFANEFASLWPLFQNATPQEFRGYVYGDMLYMRRPMLTAGKYEFTPNKVTYRVPVESQLGQRIAQSTAMVVGHAYFPEFGMPDESQQPVNDFSQFNNIPGLIVQGAKYVETLPQVDMKKLSQIRQLVQANTAAIDAFVNDEQLAAQRMANFKSDVLYRFNNQMAARGILTDLAAHFDKWLSQSNVSQTMQQKIRQWINQNSKGFAAVFQILENIRLVKDHIIDQADSTSDIEQQTGDQAGGEGYVMYHPAGNVKFVPRGRWTPTRPV